MSSTITLLPELEPLAVPLHRLYPLGVRLPGAGAAAGAGVCVAAAGAVLVVLTADAGAAPGGAGARVWVMLLHR
jgi:hypothetical protein